MNLRQEIINKKITKPGFAYSFLMKFVGPVFLKKYNVQIKDKVEGGINRKIEQHILISNHASRIDYMFNAAYVYPNKYNFLVGYKEFYKKKFSIVANLLKLIPKKNFSPDSVSVKNCSRIIGQGGNLFFFPEATNSFDGSGRKVTKGTGKFLKHYKLPIYCSIIRGGYLTSPIYMDSNAPGTVEVTFEKLFSKEDLEKYTPVEIENIINEKFTFDDFTWNKEKQYSYNTNNMAAENIDKLLYKCPKCNASYSIKGEGNTIKCSNCSFEASLDDKYNLSGVNFDTISDWVKFENNSLYEEITKDNFSISDSVSLGVLKDDEYLVDGENSKYGGEGVLTISSLGLSYVGTKNRENVEINISANNLPESCPICKGMGSFFTYIDGEYMEFKPQSIPPYVFVKSIEKLSK